MKSRNWEQRVPNSESKNTAVYSRSNGHGHASDGDVQTRSASGISQFPGYSSKAALTHGRYQAGSDDLLRPTEPDRWSVESPKESGYFSEESSVVCSTEAGGNNGTYQGLRDTESCKCPALSLCMPVIAKHFGVIVLLITGDIFQ